jgi:hypothetical protein
MAPKGRASAWPYGIERFATAPPDAPVVFVEGAIDVLAARALLADQDEAGVVLGIPGVDGWKRGSSWAQLARGRVAVLALDPDAAGDRTSARIADELADAGARRVERWTPPGDAKDWGEAWAAHLGRERAA